jgi:hypothetical protein
VGNVVNVYLSAAVRRRQQPKLTRQGGSDEDVVLALLGENGTRLWVVNVHEKAIGLAEIPVGHGCGLVSLESEV